MVSKFIKRGTNKENVWERGNIQGPRSKFSSGGAKEECVKENFF